MDELVKELRGKVLFFLSYIAPKAIDTQSIIKTMYEYHQVEDIEKALDYLYEKKLVSRTETLHPFRKREKLINYKITPKGIDTIEGTLEDPAIVVVEW